jgi:hypothetical protein
MHFYIYSYLNQRFKNRVLHNKFVILHVYIQVKQVIYDISHPLDHYVHYKINHLMIIGSKDYNLSSFVIYRYIYYSIHIYYVCTL